jgi:hypothetical protein
MMDTSVDPDLPPASAFVVPAHFDFVKSHPHMDIAEELLSDARARHAMQLQKLKDPTKETARPPGAMTDEIKKTDATDANHLFALGRRLDSSESGDAEVASSTDLGADAVGLGHVVGGTAVPRTDDCPDEISSVSSNDGTSIDTVSSAETGADADAYAMEASGKPDRAASAAVGTAGTLSSNMSVIGQASGGAEVRCGDAPEIVLPVEPDNPARVSAEVVDAPLSAKSSAPEDPSAAASVHHADNSTVSKADATPGRPLGSEFDLDKVLPSALVPGENIQA